MRNKATRLTGLFVAVAVLLGLNLYAQQTNVGGITGTVRDASGAVIPGATVEAVNQATSLKQAAVTNASGIYTLKLLPVSNYTITVTASGFQKAVKTDIPVRSGEAFTVDLQLTVGQVTETITVTGAAPILDTTTANQGTTRSADEIKGLPIAMQGVATRGAIAVVQSLAGVNADTGGQNQVWTVISRAAINGVMPGEVGYQIDGVPAGMGESESAEDFGHPTPELIQEVRLTTNADASSGFDGGVTIAMTTKSGTNQLHGNVFWYNRNAALESRTFFLKNVGQDNQNEAGFSIGGPVSVPKVYDGRNKTFFFGTLSVYRMANNGPFAFQSGVASNTVPTAAMRTGDLSALLGPQTGTDALGRPVLQGEIYDPATTRADGHGGFVRDPFMYNGHLNVIDPARLSPVSTFFQKGYVLPTSPGTQLNWTGTPYPSYLGDQRYTLKVDHTIGLNHRISFSLERSFPWLCDLCKGPGGFGQGHFDYLQGAGYLLPVVANGFFVNIPQDRYRFNYVWAKTPNVLLNFRLGMTRTKNRSIEPFPSEELRTGAVSAGLKGTGSQQTPNVNIQGVSPFGPFYNLAIWSPQKLPASVDVSWTKGNHNLIFGAQYVDVSNAFNNKISTHGSFSFATLETGLPGVSSTGAGFASFLLGEVHSATVPAPLDSRESVGGMGFFAQDSWRVTPKLTVNYGLRWDVFIPMHMGQDKISSFDPTLPNPGAGGRLGALSIYGVGSGRNGLTTVAEYYYKAFGPKLGLAYSINPKTVFRASYGISYLPYYQKYAGAVSANVPSDGFTATRTAASLDNGVTPAFNWTNGFPLTFPQFPVIDPTLDNGQNIGFLDRKDNKPSMVQNIGAEVSRELPGRLSLRLGYVGTMTHGVWSSYDMNALPLSTLQYGSLLTQDINSAGAVAAGIPLPFPGFTGSVAQALRPYPQYLSVTNMGAQVGNSTYHAFQANVQKQVGDLTFLANFTTSKQLCNVFFGGAGGFGLYSAQHPALGNKAKSICGYPSETLAGDRPKVLNLSYVWNLPFGSGKRYLGGAKGALNQVVGGWRLSAVQTYQAGGNLRVTDSRAAIPGMGSIWPVLVPNVPVKAAGGCGNYDPNNPDSRYLNINAFQDPSPFALGNVSVLPSVRRCGYLNEDLGLQKEFPITERVRFMIGALGQNLFNRHYWVNLATDIGVPASFGRFSGASSGRTIQLYGRVEF